MLLSKSNVTKKTCIVYVVFKLIQKNNDGFLKLPP